MVNKDDLYLFTYRVTTYFVQFFDVLSLITQDWLDRISIFFDILYPPIRPTFWHIQKYMVSHKILRKVQNSSLSFFFKNDAFCPPNNKLFN